MTQAVANRQNGIEQQSAGGIIIHRGPLNAAMVRSIGAQATNAPVYPRSGPGGGSGLEIIHYPHSFSQIQSYDREVDQWLDLHINAKNILIQPQAPGKVSFPQYSTEALLGAFYNPSGFAPPQPGVWTETDVRVSFTTTSSTYPWRMCFATALLLPASISCYVGLGYDGGIQWPSMQLVQAPTTSAVIMSASGTMFNYTTIPVPGPHRVSIFLYAGAGAGLHGGMYSSLFMTEMRA